MDQVLEDLWDKIKVNENGCWIVQTRSLDRGYARLRLDGKFQRVHRFTYEVNKGKIPSGLQIDHLCKNRTCCNPEHLEAVTQKENLLRSDGVNTRNSKKTHCPKGHEYTPDNIYIQKTKYSLGRRCKTCFLKAREKWSKKNPNYDVWYNQFKRKKKDHEA